MEKFSFSQNVTCSHCKSELEIDQDDILPIDRYERGFGYGWSNAKYPCGVCLKENVISNMPFEVLVKIWAYQIKKESDKEELIHKRNDLGPTNFFE